MKKIILLTLVSILLLSCDKIEENILTNSGLTSSQSTDLSNISSGIIDKNEVKIPDIKVSSGTYCLLDECIPENLKVSKIGFNFLTKRETHDENNGDTTQEYKLKTDKTSFSNVFSEMMHVASISIVKLGDYYVKNTSDGSCGGGGFEQKVYDKDGFLIKDFHPEIYPKSIKVGNIDYDLSLTETGKEIGINDEVSGYEFLYEKIDSNNTSEKIINNEIRTTKHIYPKYALRISEDGLTGFALFYIARQDIKAPLRVIYLGKDEAYLKANIGANGELKDIKVTNKILSYFSDNGNENKRISNEASEIITSVSDTKAPVFSVQKLDENGNYMTYVQKPFSWQTYAEMCKPVVYFYSKNKQKNSLSLELRKDDKFTKILPDFTSKNTWNFTSKKDGTIDIVDKNYPYFYYSLLAKDYKSNTSGWIVYGADIAGFLSDKLDKIGFNKTEKKDFLDFWLKEYEDEKYYFVSFKYKDELDKIIKLDFAKTPQNEFRVLLDSYEYNNIAPEKIEKYLYKVSDKNKFDDILIQRFDRNKTESEVFEWGGVLIKNDEIVVY